MSDAADQHPDSLPNSDSPNNLQSAPKSGDREHPYRNRNAGEVAGETFEVVGESTGRFPRVETDSGGGGESTGRSAFMVGAGILISRIIGVIRQRVFAHYLGTSDAAGAFSAAF
ncbi:MAG TPA: hypothetical protein VGP81_02250, partial [Pyrinomonadaceae bacterium]|nr:hypothetical protein [Pyrinomonadaceae bacterium]